MSAYGPASPARRRFLGWAAGATGGLAGAGLVGAGSAEASSSAEAPDPSRGLRFAVVTDTHANPEESADRTRWLRQVFAALDAADPRFVLVCGDLTDFASPAEYDHYLAAIPESLRDRVRSVPGNHETRWDFAAKELYRAHFGPTPFSFDAVARTAAPTGRLHVVGLDPTQLLQEPGHFGPEHLRWLAADLRRTGRHTPSVLFLHFPLAGANYYVDDQDAVWETLAGTGARAVFAGHIHREEILRYNGLTQVSANAVKNGPFFYWVEQTTDRHPVLRVTRVTLDDAGGETRTELTTIPLTGDGEGRDLGPSHLDLAPGAGVATVRVTVPAEAPVATVRAQLYPQHAFGRTDPGTWVDLDGDGATWSGALDTTALPDGVHRAQLRVVGADGATYDLTSRFTTTSPANGPEVRWTWTLPGQVQGGLAARGDLVVAASSAGRVQALTVGATGAKPRWSLDVGPVHRAAAFDAAGAQVVVPSADHHVHAVDAATGEVRWSFAAAGPVLSAPLVASVGAAEVVVVAAGTRLHLLDAADGGERWSTDNGGGFCGRAACDGTRVYAGSGDGHAHAYDVRTGRRVWSFLTNERATTYSRLIYGPWDDHVDLLGDDLVTVSTVTHTHALRRDSGEPVWSVEGGDGFAPVLRLDAGLVQTDEWGRVKLIDPADGTVRWTTELGHRALNIGPVAQSAPGAPGAPGAETVWQLTTTGLLAGLDIANGAVVAEAQIGLANSFSTPVLAGGLLVAADQDGVVRGVALP